MATGETTPAPDGQDTLSESIEVPADEQGTAFPPFDATTFASQLLWFAITFVILYYLMAKVALPRIGGILEGRRDRIAADLDHAERLKGESKDAEDAYLKALADARASASDIAEAARSDARAKVDAQQASVEKDLAVKLADAEKRIGDIKAQALAQVGTIAEDTSQAVIDSLVGVETTPAEIKDAVTEALSARSGDA